MKQHSVDVHSVYEAMILEQAFDWVGIDYLVRQTTDKEQTQITINTADITRLVNYIITGSKHCEQ